MTRMPMPMQDVTQNLHSKNFTIQYEYKLITYRREPDERRAGCTPPKIRNIFSLFEILKFLSMYTFFFTRLTFTEWNHYDTTRLIKQYDGRLDSAVEGATVIEDGWQKLVLVNLLTPNENVRIMFHLRILKQDSSDLFCMS